MLLHQLSVFQFRHQLTFKETSLKIAEYIFVLFIKLLSLPRFPRRYFRKRKLGRWEIYIYRKDVYLTFCSWLYRTSQILKSSQNKATVGVCGVCLYPWCAFAGQRCIQVSLYISAWASALLVQTGLGNAKAL
ncbi:hypothetical protein BSBG_04999 [Bacteroides sp. 9_1_42FAA]|nr:hypothetical protein BSBG_04999 [Bacteroides sp. 9_1_42FAA]